MSSTSNKSDEYGRTCDDAEALIEKGLALAQAVRPKVQPPSHCAICSDRVRPDELGVCDRHATEPMDERWR